MSGWLTFLLFPAALIVGFLLLKTRVPNYIVFTVVGAAFILAVANGCGYKQALHNSAEIRTITVNHKERTGGDNGKWLVFTNHGVFSVEDSLWYWKFDASDRYNEIRTGHTYRCKVAGWRIHISSDYENLIDCHEMAS